MSAAAERAWALDASIAATEAAGREILGVLNEVEAQIEAEEVAVATLHREYEGWCAATAPVEEEEEESSFATSAEARLALVCRDACGESAFLDFLGTEPFDGGGGGGDVDLRAGAISRDLRRWWLRLGAWRRVRSREEVAGPSERELVREIILWAQDPQAPKVLSSKVVAALETAYAKSNSQNAPALEAVVAELRSKMAIFVPRFWGRSSFFWLWVETSGLAAVLDDDAGRRAFFLFLRRVETPLAQEVVRFWRRVDACETRGRDVGRLLVDFLAWARKNVGRVRHATARLERVGDALEAIRWDLREVMATRFVGAFWEGPYWLAWLDEKRFERVGERLLSSETAVSRRRRVDEAARYVAEGPLPAVAAALEARWRSTREYLGMLGEDVAIWRNRVAATSAAAATRIQTVARRRFVPPLEPRAPAAAALGLIAAAVVLQAAARRRRDESRVRRFLRERAFADEFCFAIVREVLRRGLGASFCGSVVRDVGFFSPADGPTILQAAARRWFARRRVLEMRILAFCCEEREPAAMIEHHFEALRGAERRRYPPKHQQQQKRRRPRRRRRLPPVVDAETGKPLALETSFWGGPSTATHFEKEEDSPPEVAEPIVLQTNTRPRVLPWARVPLPLLEVVDDEARSRTTPFIIINHPVRASSKLVNPSSTPSPRRLRAKLARRCLSSHAAFELKLREERDLERRRHLELRSQANDASSFTRLDTFHARQRRKSRITLDRLRHDHQVAIVIQLRDAGILR